MKTVTSIEQLKDVIPDFVIKLYLILTKKQFEEFICWAQGGTEILIKNAKKFEDRVLPRYFRHKRLTSFVRQLNMYQFNKVNKITKERGYMYFKNQHFKFDCFEEIKLIKRKQKSKKCQKSTSQHQDDPDSLLPHSFEEELKNFQQDTQNKFAQIHQILQRILQKNLQLKKQINPAIKICKKMLKGDIQSLMESENEELDEFKQDLMDHRNTNNMLGTTMRDMTGVMNSLILPSICSLTHLEG